MIEQKQQQHNVCCGFHCFQKYSNFELINETELKFAINYICGNLNANYTLNYSYWYDMYSYTAKNLMVLRKKKEKKQEDLLTTLGECICQNKVINFLKNTDKKCFCNEGCASVRFKAVF